MTEPLNFTKPWIFCILLTTPVVIMKPEGQGLSTHPSRHTKHLHQAQTRRQQTRKTSVAHLSTKHIIPVNSTCLMFIDCRISAQDLVSAVHDSIDVPSPRHASSARSIWWHAGIYFNLSHTTKTLRWLRLYQWCGTVTYLEHGACVREITWKLWSEVTVRENKC